jgi:hypothetical protein
MTVARLAAAVLLVLSFATGEALGAPKRPAATKPADKPPAPAGPEIRPLDPRFGLGGRAAPPGYLRFGSGTMTSLDGVCRGEVWSVATDYADKDFAFDVVVTIGSETRSFAFGVGENGRDEAKVTNSVAFVWSGQSRTLETTTGGKPAKRFGRDDYGGVYLLRLEKRGKAATLTAAARDGGDGAAFRVFAATAVDDLRKQAPFLTGRNATLFFAGDATVRSVGLTVGGVAADPALAADQVAVAAAATAARATADAAPLVSLAGDAGLPSWLRASDAALADPVGLAAGDVRTADDALFAKDFVCDLLVRFPGEADGRESLLVGLGEDGRQGRRVLSSVYARLVPPDDDRGAVAMGFGTPRDEARIGSIPAGKGPHLVRVEKHGPALTIGVCPNYQGKFVAAFARTVADLSAAAPFLTKLNGGVFFDGIDGGRLTAARLVVGGRVADDARPPAAVAAAPADEAATLDAFPLVPLAGQAGLPEWLRADAKALAGEGGVRGGELRTVAHDLAARDFTFDLLYEFEPDDREPLRVGIGENREESGRVANSVLSRVNPPVRDGVASVTLPRRRYREPELGRVTKVPGPHLFRLRKRGDTLTLSICVGFQGKFEPTFSRTLPQLSRAADFLTKTNAAVFVAGGGTFKAVRLVVDGKSAGADAAAGAAAAAAGAGDRAAEDLAPLVPLAGQNGLPAWLKADPKALAGAGGVKGGVLRTAAHDLAAHDFTFDVLYQFAADDEGTDLVGIGDNRKDGGFVRDTVCARARGPADDGRVSLLTPGAQSDELPVGKTGRHEGPHLLRVQKRGRTLTFAVHADYDGGAFVPTFSRTLPDLPVVAPFLDASNGWLFVEAAGNVKAVRLVVDGKPPGVTKRVTGRPAGPATAAVPPPRRGEGGPATAAAGPASPVGSQHLFDLGGGRLPTYLEPQRGLAFEGGALVLRDQIVHTARADYAGKDFTFDVVYRLGLDQYEPLVVGLGEHARDGGWIPNAVSVKLHGPRHEGLVQLVVGKEMGTDVGRAGRPRAASMARLQKRGNTLTLAVCPEFTGAFQPTVSRTLPDLASAAPFLTGKNGGLFVSGKGTVERVGLVVGGEATESTGLALGLPARVVAGRPVRVRLAAGGVTAGAGVTNGPRAAFVAEAAPAGLTLTPAGDLTWTPAADQVGTHELRVKVTGPGGDPIVVSAEVEVVSADDAERAGGDLAKVDALHRLPLSGGRYHLVPGLGGRSMLLLDGDSLRRLDADGVTVRETLKLPAKYTLVGEREAYFVAVSDDKQSLDLLDKRTLAVTRSVQMIYPARWDLALHPWDPVSYVTVEKGTAGARDAVLVVDERTGDVLEPPDFVGRWVKVAPDGRTAYTGYKEAYRRGSQLLVNPGGIDVVPTYGIIDVLYVWDLAGGRPRCARMKWAAGLNGCGIALSPDGRRLSYLSPGGYPANSGNAPAFDPTNFDRRPVTYATKSADADPQDVAFHPYLEIAAAPAGGAAAACFDRESGALLPDMAAPLLPPLRGAKVKRVYFSPDGLSLLVECVDGAVASLRQMRLRLTPAQVRQMDEAKARPPAGPPAQAPQRPSLQRT